MVCGLWSVVCGLWFVVCGLWSVVCGLCVVLYFCEGGSAEIVVEGFAEDGDKEEVDDDQTGKTADQDREKPGPATCQVGDFRKSEPFTGCTAKNRFKEKIIHKEYPKKEPAEIVRGIVPEYYIPVPCLKSEISKQENQKGIDQKIHNPCPVAYCFHIAKIGKCEQLPKVKRHNPQTTDHKR